jgi:hypothetical protein
MKTGKKIALWSGLILTAALAAFIYFRFFFVFSDGFQTGELNKFSYKGYVFKTYEGIMILTGYGNKSRGSTGTVQSNYFEFSVSDKALADTLSHCTGKRIEVHYKQYFGALPWRGYERAVVDRVEGHEAVEQGSYQLPYDASAEEIFL